MSRTFGASTEPLDTAASSPVTDTPITIACWIKELALTSKNIVTLGTSGSSNSAYRLETFNGGAAIIRVNCNEVDNAGATHGSITTAQGGIVGTWRHFAAVFTDHSNRTAYLDGRGASSTGASTTGATNMVRISGDCLGVNTMTGNNLVAHVAIWNVALSASDVKSLLYLYPNQVQVASLVHYWPMTNNQSPEPDYGSGNLSATVTGATFSTDNPNIAGTLVQTLMGASG